MYNHTPDYEVYELKLTNRDLIDKVEELTLANQKLSEKVDSLLKSELKLIQKIIEKDKMIESLKEYKTRMLKLSADFQASNYSNNKN